nr:protein-glutamine gamma-glutamyltransferase 2-like [Labrus bergylta]
MIRGQCRLKLVNYEASENHISHETEGLSRKHLVVRRGKPFKITLMFGGRPWNPHIESLVLEVWLGDVSEKIRVQFSDEWSDPLRWSAKIYQSDMHPQSVMVHICSPVLSSVALYELLLHIETRRTRRSYVVGTFVLLCNPWLKDDPVYMPLGVQTQEYIKSDYGMLYMGTPLNISRQPWSFGQYEPGVLEACLRLLQVSPQHLRDKNKDYALRADPVYLSRTLCAMVNCNDDLGILMGKWQGSYKDGVKPTEWSSSADILHHWFRSSCRPVRYGQCWVFASVLCTVMRVLGIPSRVVTVFNAAHDGDGSLSVEEYYTSTGEKLNLSKDSIWNFHVWVECWMRRPDLGSGFDGWQVVDPTPQEKSAGIYCCGPCPVVAIQQHCLGALYDSGFISASVDADIIRLIVSDGLVVERTVDTEAVGQLIYTKSIGSDRPENLTPAYKGKKTRQNATVMGYQVSLKSTRGAIDVFLCPEDSSGVCSPVTDGSPSKPNADSPLVPPPAQPTDQSQARASTNTLDVGLSSPASTSSTVTAASQQDPSSLVLGGDTESLLGGDPFSGLADMPDFNFSPLSSSDFLNGEGFPLPLDGFINLSPPHSHDYHFGLEDNEGISELFDCDFGDLSQVLGDS